MAASVTAFPKKTSKATVKTVERTNTMAKRLGIPGIIKGLGVTMRHFFTNIAERKETVTFEYPEHKIPYPARNRGIHRLMTRDDGAVRCVACMCCPTACPAHCITIVAEDTGNGNEKRPKVFEIDELRCIMCGLCVEACPCDAIRMDTGEHVPATFRRADAIMAKPDLLRRGEPSIAVQGGTLNRDKPIGKH